MPEIHAILKALADAYPDVDPKPSNMDPFMTLIGCILSQRTREGNAEMAAGNLFAAASTPEDVLSLGQDRLEALIRPSGFYRQKARSIMGTCRALVDHHGGVVPREREALMRLPGVGPKTADIVLAYSYGAQTVPVDVHVWRVSRRLGLAPMDADHEEVKKALEEALPGDCRVLYDRAALRVGKEHCRKSAPRCGGCPLRGLCCHASRGLSRP
jgi:endonuclease-3